MRVAHPAASTIAATETRALRGALAPAIAGHPPVYRDAHESSPAHARHDHGVRPPAVGRQRQRGPRRARDRAAPGRPATPAPLRRAPSALFNRVTMRAAGQPRRNAAPAPAARPRTPRRHRGAERYSQQRRQCVRPMHVLVAQRPADRVQPRHLHDGAGRVRHLRLVRPEGFEGHAPAPVRLDDQVVGQTRPPTAASIVAGASRPPCRPLRERAQLRPRAPSPAPHSARRSEPHRRHPSPSARPRPAHGRASPSSWSR